MPPEHERQKVLSPELWTHLFSLQRLPPVSDTLQKCELELASRPRIRSCTPALAPTGGGGTSAKPAGLCLWHPGRELRAPAQRRADRE